jgi:hypothetical protein
MTKMHSEPIPSFAVLDNAENRSTDWQPSGGGKQFRYFVWEKVTLALIRSSRREEAPTKTPAIAKSLVTSAATEGRREITIRAFAFSGGGSG